MLVRGGHLVLDLFVRIGIGIGLGENGLGVTLGHVDSHIPLVIGRHQLGLQLHNGLVAFGIGLLDVLFLDLTFLNALLELVRQVYRTQLEELDGRKEFFGEYIVEGILHLDSYTSPIHEELVGSVEGGLFGENVDGVLLEHLVVLVLEGHVEVEEVLVVESILERDFDSHLQPIRGPAADRTSIGIGVPGELDGLEGGGVLDEGVAHP